MRHIILDLETTSISDNPLGQHGVSILGYGLASAKNAAAFEWNEANKQRLIDMAQDEDIMFVFHSASFDVPVLRRHGVDIRYGSFHDTQVMAYCLDSTHDSYSLDNCCQRYGIEGKFEKPESWDAWTDYMAEYCKQDCLSTLYLFNHLNHTLQFNDPRAWEHYNNIERLYIECIIEFEQTGFLIDDAKLQSFIRHFTKKQAGLFHALTHNTPPLPEKLEWKTDRFYPSEDCERSYTTKLEPLTAEMQQVYVDESLPIDEPLAPNMELIKTNTKTKRVRYLKWVYLAGQAVDPNEHVGQTTRGGVTYGSHCRLQDFNPNSSIQLAYVLQSKWGWQFRKTTKTGLPKTDEEELSYTLALDYPPEMKKFVKCFLDLANVSKTLGSFLLKFDELKDEHNILRGNFNQTVTVTGRLSSSEPNLQNIPSEGSRLRELFITPPGWSIVGIDLSNIEGRVFAHYLAIVLDDYSMARIFNEGLDFHSMNTINWGLAPGYTYEQIRDKVDAVAKAARYACKTLLYSILYGAGAEKVGAGDKEKGQKLMDALEQNAPNINLLKELVWQSCEKNGGVIHDFFGRRLCYPNIIWDNALAEAESMIEADVDGKLWTHKPKRIAAMLQARAKRQVFNALLQGTAASALKILTLKVVDMRRESKLPFFMCAAVHDELQIYAPDKYANELKERLDDIFKTKLFESVGITGDAAIGKSWAGTH